MGETGKRISEMKTFGEEERCKKPFFSFYDRNWQKFWGNAIVNNLKAPKKNVFPMDLEILEFHFIFSLVTP